LQGWNALSAESFTYTAFEPSAIKTAKSKTQPAQDYTLQVLHFLETELKIVFGSAVAENKRKFATDFKWQIHVVNRIISTILGKKKRYYLLRAFSTQLL